MAYFLDTSALLKRYVSEPGTVRVQEICESNQVIFIARITAVEAVAALARRAKSYPRQAKAVYVALDLFQADYLDEAFDVLDLTQSVVTTGMKLAQKHGLRGYDAVQLATWVVVNQHRIREGGESLVFVCADDELSEVAKQEFSTVEQV